jgi:hypothetical protein
MKNEVKLSIEEWELLVQVKILDPDGFDRTNPNLFNEKFTYKEFKKGMDESTQKSMTHEEWTSQYERLLNSNEHELQVSLQGEPTVCEHIEWIKNYDHSTWGKNMNITACFILIKSMLDNNAGNLTIKVDGYTDGEKPKGDFVITIASKQSEPKTN